MAINLAEKYSPIVDEAMRKGALTSAAAAAKCDFTGAKTVKVYGMGTAPMNDYKASGTNRYGDPQELEDTTQELTLTRKRSFTYTIDATNRVDSPEGVRDAAASLRRQLDERVYPELDAYLLTLAAREAGTKVISAVTKSDVFSTITGITAAIDEAEAPDTGRIMYCTPGFVNLIKNSADFVKSTEIAQNMLIKGQIGEIDGMAVVKMPTKRMPAGALAVIIHPNAICRASKLAEYKIHDNPPGLAGHLVEGLIYYDTFVLDNKKGAVAVLYGTLGKLTVSMTAESTGTGKVKAYGNVSETVSGKLVYKTGSSVSAPAFGADVSSWTELPADSVITATAGNKLCVAEAVDGKAVAASDVVTVTVGA